MRKLTADYVYPVDQAPIKEGVVVVDENGVIKAIGSRADYPIDELEVYSGALIPGLINTHCHLELSHMKGKVATGTSLIPFITGVVQQRGASVEEIQAAIAMAEAEMLAGGIVAVGDISNVPDTFAQKAQNNLRYYTFVEFFDFLQDANAGVEFDKYKAVYDALPHTIGHEKSAVPHAPYSVSKTLFEQINAVNQGQQRTISIHNQETPPENQLFLEKKGGFIDFYGGFGISLDAFEASGQTAIHYALANLDPTQRTLFVHNTLSTRADIRAAHEWSNQVYWATCPNANLYIENRLPNYQAFIDEGARLTIGTDSLTSNWQLSILEEMKTILRYQSYVPFETVLQWATLNGAQALGFEDQLGSITTGKACGINLLENFDPKTGLTPDSSIKKIA